MPIQIVLVLYTLIELSTTCIILIITEHSTSLEDVDRFIAALKHRVVSAYM